MSETIIQLNERVIKEKLQHYVFLLSLSEIVGAFIELLVQQNARGTYHLRDNSSMVEKMAVEHKEEA
jgi:hypothetical protein